MYQYFALEQFPKKTTQYASSDRATEVEGNIWTPFSGKFHTMHDSQKWFNEHGLFFRRRGIILKLFEREEIGTSFPVNPLRFFTLSEYMELNVKV